MENFQQHVTEELVKTLVHLAEADTHATYAQAAYDHFANLVNLCNTANEGGIQLPEAPGVPQ